MPIKHERTRNGAVHTRFKSSSETASTSPTKRKRSESKSSTSSSQRRHKAASKIQKLTRKRQQTCAICLERFRLQPTLTLPCKPIPHTFCKTCINKWTQVSDSCPLCRSKIPQRFIAPRAPLAPQHYSNILDEDVHNWLSLAIEPRDRPHEDKTLSDLIIIESDEEDDEILYRKEIFEAIFESLRYFILRRNPAARLRDFITDNSTLREIKHHFQLADDEINLIIGYIKQHNPRLFHRTNDEILDLRILLDIVQMSEDYIRNYRNLNRYE
jgi:hypothetical protein